MATLSSSFFLLSIAFFFNPWAHNHDWTKKAPTSCSLSGNKGLCGVPSLPSCPLLWENGHLSKGGKIAIAVSCVVVLVLVLLFIYLCCIWRGRHDYDFAPPTDLTCEWKKKIITIWTTLKRFLNLDPSLSLLYVLCSACSKEKQIPEAEVVNATGNGEPTR